MSLIQIFATTESLIQPIQSCSNLESRQQAGLGLKCPHAEFRWYEPARTNVLGAATPELKCIENHRIYY